MKINRHSKTNETHTFDELDWGDVFELNGRLFIRMAKHGEDNAVSIETGIPRFVNFKQEVFPVNGEFVVKEG